MKIRRAITAFATVLLGLAAVAPGPASADLASDEFASIRLANDGWTYEIVISNGEGTSVRTPIDRPVLGRPAFSPDGDRMVFTSPITDGTDGRFGLYIADLATGSISSFTTSNHGDFDPAWSPDGQWIAFSRGIGTLNTSTCCHLRVKPVGGGGGVAIPNTNGGRYPSWSPTSDRLTYERPEGVHAIDRDGGNQIKLTGANGAEPAWSPDGSTIAYVRPGSSGWEIATRPSGGGADTLRVSSSRRIESPRWDADSETLYYLRYQGEGYDGRSNTEVWRQQGAENPERLFTSQRERIHLETRTVGPPDPADPYDFNGDGRADVATGAPGTDTNGRNGSGAVHWALASGGFGSFAAGAVIDQSVPGIPGGPESGDAFGTAVTSGDFNGNGRADLAIGVPLEDLSGGANAGLVTIVPGRFDGLDPSAGAQIHQSIGNVAGSAESDDEFGGALAAGDFNGDGYVDLAVGAPGEDIGSTNRAGMVVVLPGSAAGLATSGTIGIHQGSPGVPGATEGGDAFGSALAAGDFNNDGFDDLAVGSPGEDIGAVGDAGLVHVFLGSGGGLTGTAVAHHVGTLSGGWAPASGDEFGAALAAGDIDGDGRDDLIAGAPGRAGAGAVWVVFDPSGAAADAQLLHQDTPGVSGVREAGDGFGSAVAAGDIDGDGTDDIGVGVPGEALGAVSGAGLVHVLLSDGTAVDPASDLAVTQNSSGVWGSGETGDGFGTFLALLDVDGDSRADLVVGTPGEGLGSTGDVGVLHLIHAAGASVAPSDSFVLYRGNGFVGPASAGDLLGSS